MSKIEKCPYCGATSPVVQGGICGGCDTLMYRRFAKPTGNWMNGRGKRRVGKHPNLAAPYGKQK